MLGRSVLSTRSLGINNLHSNPPALTPFKKDSVAEEELFTKSRWGGGVVSFNVKYRALALSQALQYLDPQLLGIAHENSSSRLFPLFSSSATLLTGNPTLLLHLVQRLNTDHTQTFRQDFLGAREQQQARPKQSTNDIRKKKDKKGNLMSWAKIAPKQI